MSFTFRPQCLCEKCLCHYGRLKAVEPRCARCGSTLCPRARSHGIMCIQQFLDAHQTATGKTNTDRKGAR